MTLASDWNSKPDFKSSVPENDTYPINSGTFCVCCVEQIKYVLNTLLKSQHYTNLLLLLYVCRKMVHIDKGIHVYMCYPYPCTGGPHEFEVFNCTWEWIKMVEVEY